MKIRNITPVMTFGFILLLIAVLDVVAVTVLGNMGFVAMIFMWVLLVVETVGALALIALVISAVMYYAAKRYGERKGLSRLIPELLKLFVLCLVFALVFSGISML